ncbi:MAG: lysophospholipid acyltransferase family protein [Candidatus Omnitrophota bacterium]
MLMYKISRIIFEILMRILFKLQVEGKENIPSAPYLVVPNHSSLVDPPLIGMVCKKDDISFLAKEELFTAPIIGIWSRSVGCIEVKRGANSVRSLKTAIKHLAEGKSVCIFPEGTRSLDGSLQDAKRGVGFLIAKAGVPVVPVYIQGSQEALPKTGGINPGAIIRVKVGKPFNLETFLGKDKSKKLDYNNVANIAMEKIAELKDKS